MVCLDFGLSTLQMPAVVRIPRRVGLLDLLFCRKKSGRASVKGEKSKRRRAGRRQMASQTRHFGVDCCDEWKRVLWTEKCLSLRIILSLFIDFFPFLRFLFVFCLILLKKMSWSNHSPCLALLLLCGLRVFSTFTHYGGSCNCDCLNCTFLVYLLSFCRLNSAATRVTAVGPQFLRLWSKIYLPLPSLGFHVEL